MTKLRVHAFSLSLDGFGAGPDQSLDHPLGLGGMAMHKLSVFENLSLDGSFTDAEGDMTYRLER